MTPIELRAVLAKLPASCPITDEYEREFRDSLGHEPWWRHQKEHLLGWLGEHNGPGAYGRTGHDYDAKYAYNHFQCAPGLVWMAEALGEDRSVVEQAVKAARSEAAAGNRAATQCRVVRELIPWTRIEELIEQQRARIRGRSRRWRGKA